MTEPDLTGRMWIVEVQGGPADLVPHLRRVYEQALAKALPRGSVGRYGPKDEAAPVRLRVQPRPVQDADILFDVKAVVQRPQGEVTWRL